MRRQGSLTGASSLSTSGSRVLLGMPSLDDEAKLDESMDNSALDAIQVALAPRGSRSGSAAGRSSRPGLASASGLREDGDALDTLKDSQDGALKETKRVGHEASTAEVIEAGRVVVAAARPPEVEPWDMNVRTLAGKVLKVRCKPSKSLMGILREVHKLDENIKPEQQVRF